MTATVPVAHAARLGPDRVGAAAAAVEAAAGAVTVKIRRWTWAEAALKSVGPRSHRGEMPRRPLPRTLPLLLPLLRLPLPQPKLPLRLQSNAYAPNK